MQNNLDIYNLPENYVFVLTPNDDRLPSAVFHSIYSLYDVLRQKDCYPGGWKKVRDKFEDMFVRDKNTDQVVGRVNVSQIIG